VLAPCSFDVLGSHEVDDDLPVPGNVTVRRLEPRRCRTVFPGPSPGRAVLAFDVPFSRFKRHDLTVDVENFSSESFSYLNALSAGHVSFAVNGVHVEMPAFKEYRVFL
jgi:hypothetical protein